MLNWFRRAKWKGVSYFVRQVRKHDPVMKEIPDEVARGAFVKTFSGPEGELVLSILASYTGANVTVIRECIGHDGKVDPYALAFHQGQSDVFRFIEGMCQPLPEEVKKSQEEEDTDVVEE